MRWAAWLAVLSATAQCGERWELRYFYDADDSELNLADLAFASARRGAGCGVLVERGRERPVVLHTADGGRNWGLRAAPEACLSLFFLDEANGWMTGRHGLYRSGDVGLSWRKLRAPGELLRVFFLDGRRGWAAGLRKAVYATADGGESWERVPEADQPKCNPEHTAYGWISFADGKRGMIAGWSRPPRRDDRQPQAEWVDPDRAAR
ncbi:MAG: WD40/YVTN/BNR-like repeat-containing protein, partial [Chloroflexaceae bacterium]